MKTVSVIPHCLLLIASAFAVSAQTTVYEQSRLSTGLNPDFTFNGFISTVSANKSTAPGIPAIGSPGSKIASTGTPPAGAGTNFILSPNNTTAGQLVNGTTYAVAITFGSSGNNESSDLVVTASDTQTTGNDTFVGNTSAFKSGNGYNAWITVGNITVNGTLPTIKFTYLSGANGRWYVDTVRFTPLPPGPTPQYWDTGTLGGSGTWDTTTANWNSSPDGSGTQGPFTQADVAVFGGTAGAVSIDPVNGITTDGGLEFDTTGYLVQSGTLTLGNGTNIAVVGAANVAAMNSEVDSTNGLCTTGLGTLVLNASNYFTGPVTLNAGTLSLGTNQTFDSLAGILAGKLSLLTNTLTLVGANNTTCSAALADAGAATPGYLIKAGPATQVLNGTSTYHGQTTIAGGALTIAADANLGAAPTAPIANQLTLSNAARLDFSAGASLNVNRGITIGPGGGLLSTGGSGTTPTIAGTISGSGNLIIPTGGFDFTGTNTLTGNIYLLGTNIDATGNGLSSIRFDSTAASGAGKIFLMPGNGKNITIRTFSYTNSIVTNAIEFDPFPGSGLYLSGAVASGKQCTLTLNGNFNGTGEVIAGLSPSGGSGNTGGTVALAGNNTAWSGGLTLQYGNLALGSTTALGTGTFNIQALDTGAALGLLATTPLSGASAVTNPLSINLAGGGGSFVVVSGTNDLELSGPVTLFSSASFTVTNTGATILSGGIQDSVPGSGFSLTMAGTGVLTLSGVNTYDGGTFINAGTLVGHVTNSIPGDVTVNGGTLQLDTAEAMPVASTLNIASGSVNLNFTGYETNAALVVGGVAQTNGVYNAGSPGLAGLLTGAGNIVVSSPFSIVSVFLESGTNGVVCWQSVPGHNYDVLTNSDVTVPVALWQAANGSVLKATNSTTCFTLPGDAATNNVFVRIRQD